MQNFNPDNINREMAYTKEQIRAPYQERARNYDISANLYYLIGFRETKY